jgi:lipopolysaccharide transport system ATP-binding protein
MSSDVAIACQAIGKSYNIYRHPQDRLKQVLFGRWRRYFHEYWALHDLTLTVGATETLGIIGRNGSGKSTLLQMIAGTLQPSTGTIKINGRVAALLELGAGFNPEFSGRENIYMAATLLGLSAHDVDRKLDDIIGFAAIGDFIEQPVKLYSSGMYARLAFAVAAHVNADIMILEEILSVGDVAFTQKCMRFIRKFKEKGTLLFVSHDTGAVLNLCDRVAWIDRGRLREIGNPKEVCHNYIVAMEQERDDSSSLRIGGRKRDAPLAADRVLRDVRADLLESLDRRNQIETFDFDPDAPWFGTRHAEITDVALETPNGERTTVLTGGEEIVLRIVCRTLVQLSHPIVGFLVKDRLGQVLFGDNTWLSYRADDIAVPMEHSFSSTFRFQMPYLPTGDYSIMTAIVDGTQENYVSHHWIEDALSFRVHSSHVARGLVGIPMLEIKVFDDDGPKADVQA